MVVPEQIENKFGKVQLPKGELLCVPLLSEQHRGVMMEHFREKKMNVGGLKVQSSCFGPDGAMSFSAWWWLLA